MGSAAIRLKFSSHIQNKSKCCLEIVPEISSVQNLNEIKWTQDAESIEYIIPIAYKIKLKKFQSFKERQNLVEAYHSCVDLIDSPSFAYLYNDLKTTVSDNKISDLEYYKDTLIKIARPFKDPGSIYNKSLIRCVHFESTKNNFVTVNRNTPTINDSEIKCSCVNKNYSTSKQTNTTKNDNYFYRLKHTISVSTLTRLPIFSTLPNEVESFAISPLCTIDASSIPHQNQSIVNFNLNKRWHKSKREKNQFIYIPNAFRNPYKNIFQRSVSSHPEARVAHFKRAMEREILPVKIMLQDLLTKCATLGLLNATYCNSVLQSIKPMDVLYKHDAKNAQNSCNRVVYSIIFDQ